MATKPKQRRFPRLETSSVVPAVYMLRRWLVRPRSQAWLARKLTVSQPTVYRWVCGSSLPETHYRKAIEILSSKKIMLDEWYTPTQLAVAYRFSRLFNRVLSAREAWEISELGEK